MISPYCRCHQTQCGFIHSQEAAMDEREAYEAVCTAAVFVPEGDILDSMNDVIGWFEDHPTHFTYRWGGPTLCGINDVPSGDSISTTRVPEFVTCRECSRIGSDDAIERDMRTLRI